MGCGASRSYAPTEYANNPHYVEVNDTWDRVWKTTGKRPGTKCKIKNVVVRRTGWRTIRIFVSSTFRDFHQEREILVKKVFPDLRLWCEALRLQLVECDLRWGVPKDTNTESTIRACLGEIDRCYSDNLMPFFLNMTSERMGWIPSSEEVPDTVAEEYEWVDGLSVTEMEILHAAYRIDNPNALFMLRDSSFLNIVPEEYKKIFVEGKDIAPLKLAMLKKMIQTRYPDIIPLEDLSCHHPNSQLGGPDRVHTYKVEFLGYNPDRKQVELGGLEDFFAQKVLEFFKERISAQYPMPDAKPDPYVHTKEQHEDFMNNRASTVFGRDAILEEMEKYISGTAHDVPFLLIGGAGTGKSSVMAKIAELTVQKAANGKIPGAGKKEWTVFHHFVGAVPGSTELEKLLKRLLLEMGACERDSMPTDLENATQLACGTLTNPNTNPTVIIVDALNQLDNDAAAELVSWVPRKLAPQIRCVFSMIPDTPQHTALINREPLPMVLEVTPLDMATRRTIVTEILAKYNKRLDDEQMDCLLSKGSSSNPLWLSLAIEELRVFGQFRQITDKINTLADGLLELEIQIIDRFEQETNQVLLVGTLCLMEVSARGLLEVELLSILANEDKLRMPEDDKDTEKDDTNPEKASKDYGKLPAIKWAEVYRNLKPFLRPFGDSGEGRLDFYHRSLSKAVRRKYFKDEDGEERADVYKFWHMLLSNFFEQTANKNRQMEEYPVHLMAVGDNERLEAFLGDWDVFDALYDEEYSAELIKYWRSSIGYDQMEDFYMLRLKNLVNSGEDKDAINARRIVVCRFFGQTGRHTAAQQLVQEAIKMEQDELGARPDNMMDLYHLSANIKDEIMKMEDYMYRSQLPRMKDIIENFEKAAAILKDKTEEKFKLKLGMIKNRLAFYYSGYNLRGGDEWMGADESKEKATAAVEEAISIFTELNDQVHLADCIVSKGVTYGHAVPEQIKCYKEAEEILLRTVGELHHGLDRLYLNMGIYYEEKGDYYKAFEKFHKWYSLSIDLYGREHPRSLRSINTLREPMYRRICNEKKIPIPELPVAKR